MARIFMTGAEAGTTDVFTTVSDVAVSTVEKRTGAYSFLVNGYGYAMQTLLAGVTEMYIRMGIYPLTWGTTNGALLRALATGGTEQVCLGVGKVNGLIYYFRGRWDGPLAVGTHPIVLNAWQCIEIYIKIADVGGRLVVKIDGAIDIDYTGDTQNTETDLRTLYFMYLETNWWLAGYLDDIAVNDTAGPFNNSWIGRGGIYVKVPAGVGTYTDLHAQGHANPWDCINEVPPDDADYMYDDTVDQKSTYALTALVPTAGTIDAINVIMRAKLDAMGTGNIARLIRSNGVDSQGADVGLDTSPKTIQENIETDPGEAPGTPFTIAAVNALEAGATVR